MRKKKEFEIKVCKSLGNVFRIEKFDWKINTEMG